MPSNEQQPEALPLEFLTHVTAQGVNAIQWFGIGPANPNDPRHEGLYTEDGIWRDDPDAEHYKLAWEGYGEEGKLVKKHKTPEELDL